MAGTVETNLQMYHHRRAKIPKHTQGRLHWSSPPKHLTVRGPIYTRRQQPVCDVASDFAPINCYRFLNILSQSLRDGLQPKTDLEHQPGSSDTDTHCKRALNLKKKEEREELVPEDSLAVAALEAHFVVDIFVGDHFLHLVYALPAHLTHTVARSLQHQNISFISYRYFCELITILRSYATSRKKECVLVTLQESPYWLNSCFCHIFRLPCFASQLFFTKFRTRELFTKCMNSNSHNKEISVSSYVWNSTSLSQ